MTKSTQSTQSICPICHTALTYLKHSTLCECGMRVKPKKKLKLQSA
ncbi:hypothetical protein NDK47_06165 [Brevibacillus ruminantium]|uniref:Uncharacterized protein n=1 Tax=Brevibacillus ruminantium TaxID=2950604 RepID=A0ABY4WQJ0_9BACL|nr:hypothetical protein [Brevibacillus ruminantium]USG66881.1 hypothetical protein NDK47_06165 [Brevibacillus ruminantium]